MTRRNAIEMLRNSCLLSRTTFCHPQSDRVWLCRSLCSRNLAALIRLRLSSLISDMPTCHRCTAFDKAWTLSAKILCTSSCLHSFSWICAAFKCLKWSLHFRSAISVRQMNVAFATATHNLRCFVTHLCQQISTAEHVKGV